MGDECVEAAQELYHYLDGELDDERRSVIKVHLDECPPCLDAFDFEADLRVVISQRCRDHVPEELKARVAQAIRDLQQLEQQLE